MKRSLVFAMTLLGTFIGAGFATGQEIFSFFVMRSTKGYRFYILSCVLLTIICILICEVGKRKNILTPKGIYEEIFGKKTGKIIFVVSSFSLFATYSATVTGGGSLFTEHLGASYILGVPAFAGVEFIACYYGIKGINAVNVLLTPAIAVLTVIIDVSAILNPEAISVMNYNKAVKPLIIPLIYAVLYSGYNIFSLVPVSLAEQKNLKPGEAYTGFFVASGLMIILGCLCVCTLKIHMEDSFASSLPLLKIAEKMGKLRKYAYTAVLASAFITTGSSCLFGLCEGLGEIGIKRNFALVLCGVCTAVPIFIGFSGVVRRIYPLVGIFGTIVIIFVMLKQNNL